MKNVFYQEQAHAHWADLPDVEFENLVVVQGHRVWRVEIAIQLYRFPKGHPDQWFIPPLNPPVFQKFPYQQRKDALRYAAELARHYECDVKLALTLSKWEYRIFTGVSVC